METEFFMRWKENGQSYYKVLKRKDMQEKFASTLSRFPLLKDTDVEKMGNVIQCAKSIFFDFDSIDSDKNITKKIEINYWLYDGNTGICLIEKNDMNIMFLVETLFDNCTYEEILNKIPQEFEIKWTIKGKNNVKKVTREQIIKTFEKYAYEDAMNNGISKRILEITPYATEFYISWDNTSEVNSFYYKDIWHKEEQSGIPIPSIHRLIWKELKLLCDIKTE